MIPKTIHYCWFGGNPLPKLAKKCIKSWKKYCPDYEIIEWNEGNFDLSKSPLYVRQAYEAKKWAFVTDYVRLKVVYDYGGIYLDTDVELLRSLSDFLGWTAYFGFEDEQYVATGLGFGAEKGTPILAELMEDYKDIPFDEIPCPVRNTEIFLRHGMIPNGTYQELEGGIGLFPPSYFCPKNVRTGLCVLTEDTHTIHHFDASWISADERKRKKRRYRREVRNAVKDAIVHFPNRVLLKMLGEKKYGKLKSRIKK